MSEKTTMKVKEHEIIGKVKHHPNDVRYPCRTTHEITDAGRKLLGTLSFKQRDLMLSGELILEEEETAEFYDSIKEKDVIGIGLFRNTPDLPAFSANMYSVEKIYKDSDYMECQNMYTKEMEEISFQDASIGLAMNLAEILYRDDKPFGAATEKTWKINIVSDESDEKSVADAEQILENLKNPQKPEEVEKELKFSDCYHCFDYIDDIYVVILNSKDFWDNGKNVETNKISHLIDKLELKPLKDHEEENAFEYNHKYSGTELKHLFHTFQCELNEDMKIS